MFALSKTINYYNMLALSCEKANIDTLMPSFSGFEVHINLGHGTLFPLPKLSPLSSKTA